MRKCENCHYWRGEEIDGFRACYWPRPTLPFWADIDEGDDHADWTLPDQGRHCPTFTQREEP